jgi:hypothetical protein
MRVELKTMPPLPIEINYSIITHHLAMITFFALLIADDYRISSND